MGFCLCVLNDYVAGIMKVAGVGVRRGQDSLGGERSLKESWIFIENGEVGDEIFIRIWTCCWSSREAKAFHGMAAQTGRSTGGQSPGSPSLRPYFHKTESVDERYGYLGSLSLSIWQLSCLQIIFLIRTIDKIHQSGKKKGMHRNEYMTLLFVKFGKQKNNKYFKW